MDTVAPLPRLASLLILVGAASACLNLQARTPPPAPALETPEAPTHLIVPVVIPEPEPIPAQPAAPPATPPKPRDSTTPTRPADRTSPPPATAPPSTTPVTEPPAAPPPVLQTTSNGPEEERKVQAVLKKANDDLGRVTYAALKSDARAHYDLAKSFITQAENALKIKNYPFAAQLAEKAANLASQLLKSQ